MDIVTAWRTNADWRRNFLADARHELSKHGSLDSHAREYRELASGLVPAEVVSLYELLRQSRRLEFEWRSEFLAFFPQVEASALPPPLIDEAEALRQMELAREQSLREFGEPGHITGDIPF